MFVKKVLGKIPPHLSNKILTKMSHFKIAHHGIQRSGTNYVNECLWRCGVRPINSFDEDRTSPRHKHCRWYADKSVIPSFIGTQYGNTCQVDNVEGINFVARYPEETVHLVVQKERESWLASIMNWGLDCKWFLDKKMALENIFQLAQDYDHYYSFWRDLAKEDSNSVAMIRLEELHKDFSLLKLKLDKIGVEINCGSFDGRIAEVPMSKADRPKIVTVEDIRTVIQGL